MNMQLRRTPQRTEEGAVLVLVLFFVLGIGLSLAALVTFAGTNLLATAHLQSERNIEYSADAVVEAAIQEVRMVAPSSSAAPSCPNVQPGGATFVVNQGSGPILATCSMGTLPSGRIVQFAACPPSNTTFATCSQNALLVAEVVYGDTGCSPGTDLNCKLSTGGSGYGTSVTIDSWVVTRANA